MPDTALQTRFICETYRGTAAGWQAVGEPRSESDASRLLGLLQRVRPDFINRTMQEFLPEDTVSILTQP